MKNETLNPSWLVLMLLAYLFIAAYTAGLKPTS
jgi:hypothetical protein